MNEKIGGRKWWLWMRNSGFGGSAPWITLEIHRVNALKGSEYEKMFGTNVGAFHLWRKGVSEKYFKQQDLNLFQESFIRQLDTNPNVLHEWWVGAQQRGQTLVESANKLGKVDLEGLTTKELNAIFLDTTDDYWKLGVYSSIPLFGGKALQEILEPYLTDIISDRGENPDNFGLFYSTLASGNYGSWPMKEERALRSIADAVREEGADIHTLPEHLQSRFDAHIMEYDWIPYKWIGPTWKKADFIERLGYMVETEPKEENQKMNKKEVIDRLHVDQRHQSYFHALAVLGDLKEMKGNAMSRAAYQLGKFRKEMQRRFGLTERQTALMLSDDYFELLRSGDIDRNAISARQDAFLWIAENGIEHILVGQAAHDRYATEFAWKKAAKAKQSYKGTPVFPGRVAGLAKKILRYEKDKGKFQSGNVLIAYRTTPHYVPLMDIASAIITTEGGITQHAAQIAREHEIPCIVGAQDIIEGVEDGQPLLVDSNKGTIEKITQSIYESMGQEQTNIPEIHIVRKGLLRITGPDIMWIDEASNKELDRKLVGNKAANQAITYRFMNVPNGFIATTALYYQFMQESGLVDMLNALPERLERTRLNIGEIERLSQEYMGQIVNANIPSFFDEVVQAYNVLDTLSVVTRSSGIDEDSQVAANYKGTSFSGIFETFLNHRTAAQVVDGIKKCWASMFSPRALIYSVKSGFDPSSNQMAVLVQEMKNGAVSGVMYTGVDDYTIVEACEGLCDPLVAGKITPAMYIIDKDCNIVYTKPANQKFAQYIDSNGDMRERSVDNQMVLQAHDMFELGMIGKKIQRYFGAPQDIEFTKTNLIYVIQNRDLTAKPTLPEDIRR